MSRRPDDNLRWVLIEPGVLARLEGDIVSGLIVYGDVSAQRLRSIRLSRLDHISNAPPPDARTGDGSIPLPSRFPEWIGPVPPSPEDVLRAQESLAQVKVGRLVPTGRRRESRANRDRIVEATTRRPGEAAADFYARFAAMVQEISTTSPSPSKAIAESTGIDPNTIKQYMHRARSLGLLPPSRRRQR
jgi:hypothetical protein